MRSSEVKAAMDLPAGGTEASAEDELVGSRTSLYRE